MFTGLIENTGRFLNCALNGESGKLTLETTEPYPDLNLGESIAVNGVCLTLEAVAGKRLSFHVLAETFRKTNLGEQKPGALLNLERALPANGRFGGHIVSGHVDAAAEIRKIWVTPSGDTEVRIQLPECVAGYLVPKGSIAVNGISLTIADLTEKEFAVRIIPTTWRETNLREGKPGAKVNLEADMLGKYVRFQLNTILGGVKGLDEKSEQKKKEISMDDLMNAGF